MQIDVVPDADAVARLVSDAVVQEATSPGRERFSLGLSGGSTPRSAYLLLRESGLDWGRIDLWLSDERWVPWDDPASNGRMAVETLVTGTDAALHRPRWSEALTPDGAAAHYEAELRLMHDDGLPDLILLGMGADGHTASLFPGTAAVVEPDNTRWYVANHVPQLDTWRLTATPWLLKHARAVVVLVAGASKAATLAEVIEGPDGVHPIQLLREAEGSVRFIIDQAAAAELGPR